MNDRINLPTLICGLAVTSFGTVLLLDRLDEVHLDFGSATPLLLALVGVVLLVGGLARRDGA
jgi:hypothetical protein